MIINGQNYLIKIGKHSQGRQMTVFISKYVLQNEWYERERCYILKK